ncbi:hypothetical protein [Pseudomonas asiatica]|uniref:hypothetical protein n=1 Tax=Pseudomonas asiatica TaxID=2219225 RepID=UPI0010C10BC3
MLNSDFEIVNERLKSQGLKTQPCPQRPQPHAPAGPQGNCLQEAFLLLVWSPGLDGTPAFKATKQWKIIEGLLELGFSIARKRPWCVGGTASRVLRCGGCESPQPPVAIDGVVFKVNSLADQERLGWNNRTPASPLRSNTRQKRPSPSSKTLWCRSAERGLPPL